MSVDDTSRSVTICTRGQSGLFADDLGLTIRSPVRTRRFAWNEISHFADGVTGERVDLWVLVIVLGTGRKVAVECTTASSAAPETLAAIRLAAHRYRIRAELSGVPMRDGRPTVRGLYEDPGGQPSVRYWDGSQWSPLLALGVGEGWLAVHKSAPRWAELPKAQEPWRYPAMRAASATAWMRGWAALAAALVIAGITMGVAQGGWETYGAWFFILASLAAVGVIPTKRSRSRWQNLDKSANGPALTAHDAVSFASLALAEDGGLPQDVLPAHAQGNDQEPYDDVDELPVPRRPVDRLIPLGVGACVICGAASAGLSILNLKYHSASNVPGWLAWLEGGAGMLTWLLGWLTSNRAKKQQERLGFASRSMLVAGWILGFIAVVTWGALTGAPD